MAVQPGEEHSLQNGGGAHSEIHFTAVQAVGRMAGVLGNHDPYRVGELSDDDLATLKEVATGVLDIVELYERSTRVAVEFHRLATGSLKKLRTKKDS